MELIKEAVSKARASLEHEGKRAHPERSRPSPPQPSTEPAPTAWALPWTTARAALEAAHLEEHRIVSFATKDPAYVAFNLLRTKVQKLLKDAGSKSLAITSPTTGCGKTMVAINLAFSLARQANCRTVLIDLDLSKSAIARTLGVSAKASIGDCLQGARQLEECFVQLGDNLIVGLNAQPVGNSAELMHGQGVRDLVQQVHSWLAPEIMIFDLPPMLASDDAIAFIPQVESVLLVAGAGKTTAKEISECETQIGPPTNFLGVVLNKAEGTPEDYYHYTGAD